MDVYDRMKTTCERLHKKYGEKCTWVQRKSGTLIDPNKPYNSASDDIVEYKVYLVFSQDDLEDRQLIHYRPRTATRSGLVNATMPAVDFIPNKKDTVIRNGEELVIAALDVEKPGSVIIMHYIEFKA